MPTLDWIGKDKVINHHKDVPYKVLERKYSFDESGMHKEDIHSNNMIIHGDNLEALKSLLPQYEGKIKCIFTVFAGNADKLNRFSFFPYGGIKRRCKCRQ